MSRSFFFAAMLLLAYGTAGYSAESDTDQEIRRRARSILSNKCFVCHGPDDGTREADLRLDTFEGATADLGGHQAVAPGKPAVSELMKRIQSTDAAERMPPPDSKLTISDDEIETLQKWIEQGATFVEHWAFRELRPTVPPEVIDAGWARSPIDLFIAKRLADVKLSPSSIADRATRIRRVYLDMLGITPSPGEVDAFVRDTAPGAYGRMVDRVLASPHYGERWGRHWLDQARYADTHGYTVDTERTMWPYRDWVIRATNHDMPFDQFTIEQLAGDLLPNATNDQLVATGFHRNTLVNQEGGSDREQFRNEAVVDRVNTTGAVWLGLTVGCAQCHNHKFDPITQRDYYQLFAFFNSQQDANGVSPTLQVAAPRQQQKLAALEAAIATAKNALSEYDVEQDGRRNAVDKRRGKPAWRQVELSKVSSASGATFESLEDGSWVVSGANSDDDVYTLAFKQLPELDGRVTAVRIEALTHPSLPKGGPGRAGNGNFVLNEIKFRVGQQDAQWLHASADHSQAKYPVASATDGDLETGWAINVSSGNMNVQRTAIFVTAPLKIDAPEGRVQLLFGKNPPAYNLGRFRLSVTDAPHADLDLPDPMRSGLKKRLDQATQAREKFVKGIPSTMIMRDLDKPRESFIHIRGDFLRKGEKVQPDVPARLPPLQGEAEIPNRLDLAGWLVDARNPLTARVTVNRVWGRLFGTGLVETENDFGMQSVPPTHPQLLDWLAADFRDSGWSLKRLHRVILLSSVYQQSSKLRSDLADVDPLNKLLGRQNRIRVDAEIVRDVSLAAAGLLSRKIGGPSVRPPQPSGVYAFTQRRAAWTTSEGADRYRRGMYTFFMRSAPYPMLTTFDAPKFNTTCTRRVRSNTPLQSLTMANDATMLEAARALGKRIEAFDGDLDSQIDFAWRVCFSRPAPPNSRDVLRKYYDAQLAAFGETPDQAQAFINAAAPGEGQAKTAAWTAVARVLMNLDEFIVRD